jgi:hypothetical protein
MNGAGASNYFFSAGAYVGGVPLCLSDVSLTDSATFINWLIAAQVDSVSWFIDQGGTFYPADISQRRGDEYSGSATLVGISGVPESSTWAMMLIGFAGIGFAAYRRHIT